ncbi:MAG: alkyl hydroperoxide reductase/Thiol specific antioxidant/Mal allergen [Deltaproteobacteria bacterium]|nr:alkyl hydroperoxide reductase/Thiol specific antioxidant/Mal allergen [Deltaproteobacteria bacterium]
MRAAGLAVLILSAAHAAPAHADVLKKGDRLAELDVAVDANAKPARLKTYKDSWIVVTVGAEWCKPCAKELPTWDKLAGTLHGKVTFVAIDVDNEVDAGKRFHKKLKLKNMKLVYMPSDKSAVAAKYGAETMPSTFVIDPKGVVQLVKDGFDERNPDGELKSLRSALDKLGIK